MKNVLLIIGNGLSIDPMSRTQNKNIDTRDLFKHGSRIKWPEDEDPGFLSYKNTPNLWSLGIRPGIESEKSKGILEDIITCYNVYSIIKNRQLEGSSIRNLYNNAYIKLSVYLHFLFSYYNNQIDDQELRFMIVNWPYIKYIKRLSEKSDIKVCIVSYNYDVWLERIMSICEILFFIDGIEDDNGGIRLVKPHGSISFVKTYIERSQFQKINLSTNPQDCDARDLKVEYDRLEEPKLIYPIIPPAGESSRIGSSWASTIRTQAVQFAKNMKEGDEVTIIGLSYWNVDRAEIDELLVSTHPEIKARYVDPYPNRSLMAVLASIFTKFVFLNDSNAIEELIV